MQPIRTIYQPRPAATGRNPVNALIRHLGLRIGPKRPPMLKRIRFVEPAGQNEGDRRAFDVLSMWLGMACCAASAWAMVSAS